MSKVINGKALPNIPWEECPKDYDRPVWRYSANPVIKRHPNKVADRVFNSALVPFEDGYVGVFRCDKNDGCPFLFVGRSKDGIHFEIEEEPIHFVDENGKPVPDTEWQYDPRVIPLEGKYYVVWCDEFDGATISVAETTDFKTFVKYDNPFLPNNRNGVLFPRKVNGHYLMLSRPSDIGHTPFGDIFLSQSKDLNYWGKNRVVVKRGWAWWNALKIGGGPAPIEIEEGWLIFIHGVQNTCGGYVYSMGAIIVDRDDPTKILYQCQDYLMAPEEWYETSGFVANVVFPTCTLVDAESGKIAIYYGSADTYTGLAFTTVDKVVDYIKKHSI